MMRRDHLILNALLIAASVCLAAAQTGGPYTIKDATLEGSGHESSGGVFGLEIRLGQGLAGQPISGGTFAVGGGFYPAPPPVLTAPSAPADLTGVAVSTGRVTLSWTDTSDNEEGFIVERCAFIGKRCRVTAEIASLGPGVTSFDDLDVKRNTSYEYRVYAFNAVGASSLSNTVIVTTPRR